MVAVSKNGKATTLEWSNGVMYICATTLKSMVGIGILYVVWDI
tara:strand:+ start:529 stop:657 length:129 start_codon:yes stop_codon:yes gene_type:complete